MTANKTQRFFIYSF